MSVHRRQTKTGVRWDVRLRRSDGTRYSRTFRTRAEAERFQATELADRARGSWLDPLAGETRLADWADEWYRSSAHGWRPRTAAAHRTALDSHWLPRFGQQRLAEITPRAVRRAINDLAERYEANSIRTYYSTLRSLLGAAVEHELIGRTPYRGIKRPALDTTAEKRVIGPGELHDLADAVGPRWRSLIYLGGVMGLRFGEAIALRPKDLDLPDAEPTVRRTAVELGDRLEIGSPKTRTSIRTLVMPAPLVNEVATHIADHQIADDGLLFADGNGGPIRRSNFARQVFRPAIQATGLDGLTFHGLRHSAATQWVADGIDVRTAQYRLGHSDPGLILRLYAHASTDADRQAAERTASTYWNEAEE